MKQFPLEHKTAVVTGCAGGIGAGIALGLAEAGADIVGVDLQDLEETAAQVRTLGRRFLAFRVDLSDREAVDAAWTQILAEAGGVDILVNNAGMQYRQNAYEYPLDVFDKVIAVNLRAGYQLAQLAAGHYRAEKKRDHQPGVSLLHLRRRERQRLHLQQTRRGGHDQSAVQ